VKTAHNICHLRTCNYIIRYGKSGSEVTRISITFSMRGGTWSPRRWTGCCIDRGTGDRRL